ncbi:MAG TPA: aminotransferase class V-fold PLP-dependent enzyme [Candidatus Kapabacteria bacterium]|nr:aminotransferase class V-fold PLP-dependent enzyme [Candidatus Kapabacteria bacterium]
MPTDLRSFFLLRPEVAFLNHGSFGATPRPVMARYQEWQMESEGEPVEFHARRAPGLLRVAREALGELVGADADDLVYVTNATVGVNIVARSLRLGPDDEVLGTDHEYGACDRIWRYLATRGGARYRQAMIPVPVTSHEAMLETLFAQVTPATRVLFISHITAPTALTFPVAEACRRARALGLITIVDGAHVPGQLALDLRAIDADFYTGNLHKWLCAPKGSAFLYARRDMQPLLDPLVVSWGYEAIKPTVSRFIDEQEYRGTRELAGPLSVPEAIAFQREHDWDAVRERCHAMLLRARPLIADALDAPPLSPDDGGWFAQMSAFALPASTDGVELQRRLFEEHLVEIPTFAWNGRQTLRISIQGYNTWEDIERLLEGIRQIRRG